jgi:hypothetical protein
MAQSSITPKMKLQRNENAISVDIDGETVMMDIDKGCYFALTGSGGHIWAALENPATIDEITQHVHEEFDTSGFGDIKKAVADFVGDLFENGLVIDAD